MPPTTTFALHSLDLGEGNSGQWKAVGFNIDGKVSTATSTDLCQPNSGANPATVYPDGNNGIDNSFGKLLVPIMLSLDPTWVTDLNGGLGQGSFNTLLQMACLPPMGDVAPIATKLFVGTPLAAPPKFDGTDSWSVAPELLSNPADPTSSSITFANASITAGTYDSGTNQTYVIRLPFAAQGMSTSLDLTLHAARLTMTLSADRKSATGGMLGGVINTEDLVAQIKKVGTASTCAIPRCSRA
jgi:hypothetical protein